MSLLLVADVLEAAWDVIQERGLENIGHTLKPQLQQQQRRSFRERDIIETRGETQQSAEVEEKNGRRVSNGGGYYMTQQFNNMQHHEPTTAGFPVKEEIPMMADAPPEMVMMVREYYTRSQCGLSLGRGRGYY